MFQVSAEETESLTSQIAISKTNPKPPFSFMIPLKLTFKAQSLYVAYAPQFDVSAYGGCQDEALNNLTEQIRQAGDGTGEERK
jgi:hypothetical protein